MTIPFLDLFKKLTGRRADGGTAVADVPTKPAPRVVRPKKADGERLSKTVMPNATRSLSAATPDPFRSAATTTTAPRSSMPLELGARKITASSGSRPRASLLPPALARALEPKLERTVSLRIADLVDAVPAGFIKPIEILDTNAVVSLKASELEKGMPDRHPTIALQSLYQQVPEIFVRSVRTDDDTRVELPYEKVLEQFQGAQVRTDQVRDPEVPHVDTPILTATIEDSKRFGTKIEPVEMSLQPFVPVKHASAKSIAEAEPDASPAQPEPPAVKTTASGQRVISLNSPELKPKSETPEPSQTPIPFELSPNGTGASASERVPASSGPPVPTPLPFTPDLPKIAFQLPSEEPELKKPEPKPEAPIPAAKEVTEPVKSAIKPPREETLPLRLRDPFDKKPIASPPPLATKPEKPVVPSAEPAATKPKTAVEPVKSAVKSPLEETLTLRLQDPIEKSAVSAAKVEKPFTLSPTVKAPSAEPAAQTPKVAAEKTTVSSVAVAVEAPGISTPALRARVEKPITPPATTTPAPFTLKPKIVAEPAANTPTISFSLKAVLQNLPSFQLVGDAGKIADDARITFPLGLVEPQLASGRVSIAPEVFEAALPDECRGLFHVDAARTPVALPLEEVLKNLPATVLKLRDDQVAVSLDKDFETPFFLKAQEDARRFKPKAEAEEKVSKEPASTAAAEPAAKPSVEKVDPKEIVARANALAGVRACAITFSDGLSLAGELPEEVEADGLCAMAPSMLERIAQHVRETKLGPLVAMTLYAQNSAVSFFASGNVCLTALHEKALTPETRTGLAELMEKLSKTYAQPETSNVDH